MRFTISKHKVYLFIINLMLFSSGFGQNRLKDRFDYKVTYELTYRIDSLNLDEEKSEFMILFMGDELSVFSSRAKTLANQFVVRGNMGHTSREAVTDFLFITVKSRETGKIYNTVELAKDLFYYEQEQDLFDWEVHPEKKTIKSYKAQKATTSFAGRDYVAWFTPEVPVPEGPYKFNGLPGLILEISDTEDHWVYGFIGLEKFSPAKSFRINFKHYIELEKEPLLERFNNYRRDPMGYMFAQGLGKNITIEPEVKKELAEKFSERLEKMNNPLELE